MTWQSSELILGPYRPEPGHEVDQRLHRPVFALHEILRHVECTCRRPSTGLGRRVGEFSTNWSTKELQPGSSVGEPAATTRYRSPTGFLKHPVIDPAFAGPPWRRCCDEFDSNYCWEMAKGKKCTDCGTPMYVEREEENGTWVYDSCRRSSCNGKEKVFE